MGQQGAHHGRDPERNINAASAGGVFSIGIPTSGVKKSAISSSSSSTPSSAPPALSSSSDSSIEVETSSSGCSTSLSSCIFTTGSKDLAYPARRNTGRQPEDPDSPLEGRRLALSFPPSWFANGDQRGKLGGEKAPSPLWYSSISALCRFPEPSRPAGQRVPAPRPKLARERSRGQDRSLGISFMGSSCPCVGNFVTLLRFTPCRRCVWVSDA